MLKSKKLFLFSFIFITLLFSFTFYYTTQLKNNTANANRLLTSKAMKNETAYIVSQCYTKTFDENHNAYNPCYVCHKNSQAPNYNNDADLQESYAFPSYATKNHWKNLFKDRRKEVAQISDTEIKNYVKENNYRKGNKILLAEKLKNLPSTWDFDNDGKWSGYTPDCYFQFDGEGFDRTPQGDYTGWRAFAYYPFLGTFWPTNGSTDDVLIRLSPIFQKNIQGIFDKEVYRINLAIVESVVKRKDIVISKTDEKKYTVDLNQNGKLDTAEKIVFHYSPFKINSKKISSMSYVGLAKKQLSEQKIHLAAGLFPEETEFLHSVRYIDTDENNIRLAARMKELRYGKKFTWLSYADLAQRAQSEIKENFEDPDAISYFKGNIEKGILNKTGWVYQGFIEDSKGNLRPQTYEEQIFCIGCHGNLGATTDTVFSFTRKLTAKDKNKKIFQEGWYHWSQKNLNGLPEPRGENDEYEYSFYLLQNKAGDEFRANKEVRNKFFDKKGNPMKKEFMVLHKDITHLLFPSYKRALQLNKAYKIIVQEQSFIFGRDATLIPLENVHKKVQENFSTKLKAIDF